MRLLLVVIFLIGLILPLFSVDAGLNTADFLNMNISARTESLGNAGVADNESPLNIFLNPAALAQYERNRICFSLNDYVLDIKQVVFGYYHTINKALKYGITFNYLSSGDIIRTTVNNPSGGIGRFKTSHYFLNATLSNNISQRCGWGINVKYITEKLDFARSSSVAFDAGMTYELIKNEEEIDLIFGVSVLNIGTRQKFINRKEHLPRKIKNGFKMNVDQYNISIVSDYTVVLDGENYFSCGVEYMFKKIITLRAGYDNQDTYSSDLFYGLGVRYKNIELDVSHKTSDEFSSTMFITLSLEM